MVWWKIRNSKLEIRNQKSNQSGEKSNLRAPPARQAFRISDFERSEATQATHLSLQKNGQFRIS